MKEDTPSSDNIRHLNQIIRILVSEGKLIVRSFIAKYVTCRYVGAENG